MTVTLRFFLPEDGFQTKSFYGPAAEKVLQEIGDRRQPNNIRVPTMHGYTPPGEWFQLTEEIEIRDVMDRVWFFRVGEVMLCHVEGLTH